MQDNQGHIIHHEGQNAQNTTIIRKRSGILSTGSTVMTITHDGFLTLEAGYFVRESYRYYLQNASIARQRGFLFAHRYELSLKSGSEQKQLRLPIVTGSRFVSALSQEMNNAQDLMPRSGENNFGFPPKRKLIDWIITLLIVAALLVGGYYLFRNAEPRSAPAAGPASTATEISQAGASQKATPEDSARKSGQSETSFAGKVEETVEEGRKLWESLDRSSVWNSILPHTKATSDLALSVAFIVVLAVLLGTFMPARIMRFITLTATLVCIAVAVKVIYQLDFSGSDLLRQILYATAPLLLALVMALTFYLISRRIGGDGYHLSQRLGYLVSFILFLATLWIFSYGYLGHHGFSASQMPSTYPVKILQLGDSGYIYVTAGVILVMLVLGSILKVRRCAGLLGVLCSLTLLGHQIYAIVSSKGGVRLSVQTALPAVVMLVMLIVSIAAKNASKKA